MVSVCPSCGFEAEDQFKFCPMCGSKITSDEESRQEKFKFYLISFPSPIGSPACHSLISFSFQLTYKLCYNHESVLFIFNILKSIIVYFR